MNIKRILALIRWHIALYGKKLLSMGLILSLITAIIIGVYYKNISNSIGSDTDVFINQFLAEYTHTMALTLIIYYVISILIGSMILFDLSDSKKRIAFMLLPARSSEKFLVRFLFCFIVIPCILLVTFFLTDILQMGIQFILNIPIKFISLNEFQLSKEEFLLLLVIYLFFHSIFMLCGMLLRKFQMLGGIIISVIIIYILISSESVFGKGLLNIPSEPIFYVLTILFYWLSYRIFNSMQAVQNKWINL